MRRNRSPLLEALDRHALELHSASGDEPVDVGARLRAVREGRRLSIKALALDSKLLCPARTEAPSAGVAVA